MKTQSFLGYTTRLAGLVGVAAITLSTTSCYTPEGRGALYGATAGAVIGNLVNPQASTTLRGAGIGAGVGALLGALVGEGSRTNYYDRPPAYYRDYDRRYHSQALKGGYYSPGTLYPTGSHTRQRGFVRSPYRPHNIIDVRGIPRGALVVDPSVEQVFVNP
ncbi:MAG: YMGG-like glycine zipper-containing protein [Verrucomicrobiales bacterium]